MNRRDFLQLLRGLAVLPFVKSLPAATCPERSRRAEALTDTEVEGIRRLYEGLPPDDSRVHLGYCGREISSGQAVGVIPYQATLTVWEGEGQIIGIAARDIAPGETVEWRIGGNSKDIITSGFARVAYSGVKYSGDEWDISRRVKLQ